ncbi:MAG: tyrosine-type recombinase/integrase [Bacteroidaceae bacterium]|nr:tyrosine-type recombinase/integrase [Bacteroidaceae bacterium]
MDDLIKVEDAHNAVSVTPRFDDLANKWFRYLDVAPRSVHTYMTNIRQFLVWLANNNITRPTREDIIAYRDSLKTSHRPSTIQGYMASIRLFFQFLETQGIYHDIAKHIKSPKLDHDHKRDYLTSGQSKELLATCDHQFESEQSLRDRAILSVMLTTGLRTISIINANISDIGHIGDNTVLYYLGKGHSEKSVFVKLTAPVERAIRQYLSVRGEVKDSDPLFASISNRDRGGRLTTKSIRRMVKSRLVNIGLNNRRVSAHSLRHTAATLNLLAGGSLEETQQMLDHSSITTTQIYSHHLDRINNQSEQRVSDLVFG